MEGDGTIMMKMGRSYKAYLVIASKSDYIYYVVISDYISHEKYT